MKKINIGISIRNPFKILNDHRQLNGVVISDLAGTRSLAHVICHGGIKCPVENKSLIAITFNLIKESFIREINNTFEKATLNEPKNVLFFKKRPYSIYRYKQ